MLVDGRANAAYTGAVSYFEALERGAKVKPIAASIDKYTARPWYRACIIVAADRPIKTLQDLKGKRVAFVSRSSTSGYLMPLATLKQLAINPSRDFAQVMFGSTHAKTEALLETGQVDAIATNIPSYIKRQKLGKLTPQNSRLLWESAPVPHSPFLVTTDLPPELIENLKQAFLTVPPNLQDIVGTEAAGYTLMVPSDEEHAKFQKLLDRLADLIKTSNIENIRQRYEIFERLETQVSQSAKQTSLTSIADAQQDFRAINSVGRDISFFLNKLEQQARHQAEQAEQELAQVQAISTMLSYSSVALLILLVFGEFWLILRPIIRSLHTLQQGASEIGAGHLSHRLDIRTGDEIEQLADAFNQIGAKLEESRHEIECVNADLEQRVSDRTIELKNTLDELQRTQSQVVQSEKMSSLGQLVLE